ncbi:MAG TPA: hypothetical protein VIM73_05440 [Polyangiaceae bacterium]
MTGDVRANAEPGLRPWRRWLLRVGAALLVLSALYFATLFYPQMFFSWARDGASIHVRSDEPIPESAAEVIALAESRIRSSPVFDPARTYPVYVCNARWRWNYFSAFNARSRGFQTPLGRAVFVRPARWDTNHLAGPDGRDGPRPLDVYIAHEVTHMMVADHLGLIAGRRLPVWLREGYAEYVARRETFDYHATRTALIAGDEGVAVRDRYWKYLLLVSHLLDREGLDVRAVLNDPPDPHEVEARVRASATGR